MLKKKKRAIGLVKMRERKYKQKPWEHLKSDHLTAWRITGDEQRFLTGWI